MNIDPIEEHDFETDTIYLIQLLNILYDNIDKEKVSDLAFANLMEAEDLIISLIVKAQEVVQ